jgi:hypothetical protein
MQFGIALAMGIGGTGLLGLVGPTFVGGIGALWFLFAAEVLAATAVVSEAVLIYVARMANLVVSLATLAVQALATVLLIKLAQSMALGDMGNAAAAGAGLMVALGLSSLVKSQVLARFLKQSINNWRWALLWAAVPALAVGATGMHFLPEWAALLFAMPASLAVYGWVIWHTGFGPEDRMLFRKNAGAEIKAEVVGEGEGNAPTV